MPDDFETALREAWPNEDWTPDRIGAAREAFRLSSEPEPELEEEGMGMGPEGGPGPKKGAGLALIFGEPKKPKLAGGR